jgi:Signal transduction histidine kinase involved in nitrogen fixation and metabolism regulation
MKIGARLGLGFGLVLALMIALAITGLENMGRIQGDMDHIYNNNNAKINLANEMMNSMDVISRELPTLLLLQDAGAKQNSYSGIQEAREKYGQAFDKLKNMENSPEGKTLLDKAQNAISDAASSNNKVIELGMANQTVEAIPLLINESIPGMTKISEALQEVVNFQKDQSKLSFDGSVKAYHQARLLMFLLGGIALGLGVLIAFFIARSVSNPVRKLTAMADKLALGDVNIEIEASSNDEIGMLSRSFKTMAENIKGSAVTAQKVAAGELDVEVKVQSDKDLLGNNLGAMVKTIRNLLKETNILIQAIREGKLDIRGNASSFPGGLGANWWTALINWLTLSWPPSMLRRRMWNRSARETCRRKSRKPITAISMRSRTI